MLRSIIGYLCYALSLGLLVGAVWLNDGAFGAGFLFLVLASVFLLLAVLILHSKSVRL
jgi:hypothetical protein